MKTYSGFTTDTANNLLLDAGAFFLNFDVGTDTFASAVSAGKLLGATQGGGEFGATPEVRQIEVDGVKGKAKGLEVLDSWEVYLDAKVLEVTQSSLEKALMSVTTTDEKIPSTEENANYKKITANNEIELTDYVDNITWIGTISGSDNPVIIQVYNALMTDGLKLTTSDKSQAVMEMKFYGHYTQDDLETPPFAIYVPDQA